MRKGRTGRPLHDHSRGAPQRAPGRSICPLSYWPTSVVDLIASPVAAALSDT